MDHHKMNPIDAAAIFRQVRKSIKRNRSWESEMDLADAPSPFKKLNTTFKFSGAWVAKLCNGYQLNGLGPEQTAFVLALCQQSGWSADRIAITTNSKFGFRPLAEDIWDLYKQWVTSPAQVYEDASSKDGHELMDMVLQEAGINLNGEGKPLSGTFRPKTIDFRPIWDHKNNDGGPICKGFSLATREQSKEYLMTQKLIAFGKLTEVEKPMVAQFGPTIKTIFEDALKRWLPRMKSKLRADGVYRPMKEAEHVKLALSYTKIFQDGVEYYYGKMESPETGSAGVIRIQSTTYCAKVVLGMLMADRLAVIKKLQEQQKYELGFLHIEVKNLAQDKKCCSICRDEMGIPNSEGEKDVPVMLIICCGQTLGKKCLKSWLEYSPMTGNTLRDTCPVCRYQFPPHFINNLFIDDQPYLVADFDGDDNGNIDEAIHGEENADEDIHATIINDEIGEDVNGEEDEAGYTYTDEEMTDIDDTVKEIEVIDLVTPEPSPPASPIEPANIELAIPITPPQQRFHRRSMYNTPSSIATTSQEVRDEGRKFGEQLYVTPTRNQKGRSGRVTEEYPTPSSVSSSSYFRVEENSGRSPEPRSYWISAGGLRTASYAPRYTRPVMCNEGNDRCEADQLAEEDSFFNEG